MNRYDENYSAYFVSPSKEYPEGSAIDCSSEEQLDGTPIRAAFFNDVIGFMQAAFHGVFGNPKKEGDTVLREVSNEPDTAEKSDVWDAIVEHVRRGDSAEKEVREAADATEKEAREAEDARLLELIESVKNSGMWCPFPVGAVYTQYPNCESPTDLWAGTQWQKLNYGGAFFRADGGAAVKFNAGVQPQATAVNGLKMSTITQSHSHQFTDDKNSPMSFSPYHNWSGNGTGKGGYANTSTVTQSHSHSLSGDTETRPVNYTIQIWKRTE